MNPYTNGLMPQIPWFICDAYEDETGNLKVPRSLCMEKDISDSKEIRLLKAYRPKNRRFLSREDCDRVLDWVSKAHGDASATVC